jgi:predicted nucleotidyltransferase component of viral defense system
VEQARTRDDIASDYQAARAGNDRRAMARYQNEEACLVLLTLMERLAADGSSFIHDVAVKGGILMAGELRSPRMSADIDVTSGRQRRIDSGRVISDVRTAGREYNVRLDGAPRRTMGGEVIDLAFDSLTDGGTAKIEISVREDLVFAVRDAVFNVSDLGLTPFMVPALAEVELVAEKIRTLVQRAQPRDLYDLHLYLTDSGWHFEPRELREAIDAKLKTTRYDRWKPGLWQNHLAEIETNWRTTLEEWVAPDLVPDFTECVADVERRLRELRIP